MAAEAQASTLSDEIKAAQAVVLHVRRMIADGVHLEVHSAAHLKTRSDLLVLIERMARHRVDALENGDDDEPIEEVLVDLHRVFSMWG